MFSSLEYLRRSPLFANLNGDDFQQVEAAVRYKRVAAGKPLMDANQPGSMVYLILEGSVKVFDEDSEGRLVDRLRSDRGSTFRDFRVPAGNIRRSGP